MLANSRHVFKLLEDSMKKTYEKPILTRHEKLSQVTAQQLPSKPN